MKEFDTWYRENIDQWGYIHQVGQTYIAKDAWKAALKWVQLRLKFGSDVAYSEADILMAIKKEIREELEK